MDRSREKLEERLAALRLQYEGSAEVVQSRVEEVSDEVVAVQDPPVLDQQLCGMTGLTAVLPDLLKSHEIY